MTSPILPPDIDAAIDRYGMACVAYGRATEAAAWTADEPSVAATVWADDQASAAVAHREMDTAAAAVRALLDDLVQWRTLA